MLLSQAVVSCESRLCSGFRSMVVHAEMITHSVVDEGGSVGELQTRPISIAPTSRRLPRAGAWLLPSFCFFQSCGLSKSRPFAPLLTTRFWLCWWMIATLPPGKPNSRQLSIPGAPAGAAAKGCSAPGDVVKLREARSENIPSWCREAGLNAGRFENRARVPN